MAYRYRIEIELFDYSQVARPSIQNRNPNYTYPSTLTGLPIHLDTTVQRSRLHRLEYLFSRTLPVSRPLDAVPRRADRTAPAYPIEPLLLASPSKLASTPLVWSEPHVELKPPPVATADLYTPSKGMGNPVSEEKTKPEAVLDFRFGPLYLDWIDSPLDGKQRAGTSDLNWGSLHLFREAMNTVEAPSDESSALVGLISVPGNIQAGGIMAFLAPALSSITQIRILRDSTPNRSLAVLRFRSSAKADEFRRLYNGKAYYDNTKDSELCQAVQLSAIKIKVSNTPLFSTPSRPFLSTSTDAVELPTCPVCLERMDSSVTGLVTILCGHDSHCNCLLKWGDSRCPVCCATNQRTRRSTLSTPCRSQCEKCDSIANLWMCLICGKTGCGRYQGGHAYSHYLETAHYYAIEVETERVWDYEGDRYVHRLIRNRADGKLVELPSLARLRLVDGEVDDEEDLEKKKREGTGPKRSDEESQDQLEAMGIEYATLISAQLESQREYYEEELSSTKEKLAVTSSRWDESQSTVKALRKSQEAMQKEISKLKTESAKREAELMQLVDQLRKREVEESAQRKRERAQFEKVKKELTHNLDAERELTQSLTENLTNARNEVKKTKEEYAELNELVSDLSFQISTSQAIMSGQMPELAGGSIGVTSSAASKKKKKNNKK